MLPSTMNRANIPWLPPLPRSQTVPVSTRITGILRREVVDAYAPHVQVSHRHRMPVRQRPTPTP